MLPSYSDTMCRIGFYGSGTMASSIIRGFLTSGFPAERLLAYRRTTHKLTQLGELGVQLCDKPKDIVQQSQILVLGVKPWQILEVCQQIRPWLPITTTIVSIAAGITHQSLAKTLPDNWIIRTMPNTPVALGNGVTALYSPDEKHQQTQQVLTMFSKLGFAFHLDDEQQMHAVTALSGSGPAYYFEIMAQMQRIGISLGIDSDIARSLVVHTLIGAGLLAKDQQVAFSELRAQVVSKGGTTEAALKEFNRLDLSNTLEVGLRACYTHSKNLSKI